MWVKEVKSTGLLDQLMRPWDNNQVFKDHIPAFANASPMLVDYQIRFSCAYIIRLMRHQHQNGAGSVSVYHPQTDVSSG